MISGENFQSIAEVSFLNAEPNGTLSYIVGNQIKSKPQNIKLINETSIEEVKKYKIIYVYTHFLDDFLSKFAKVLTNETILITGNSDNHVTEQLISQYNPNFKVWYCQNKDYINPKLKTIPIGLANSQWPHGNQELITSVKDKNQNKDILVYKNFDINTNISYRNECDSKTSRNGIMMSPKTTNLEYWNLLSRSVFTISPRGNGIDCHRIWECLFLKTIPVVLNHPCFSDFKHLPILFIDDWSDVTVPYLREKYEFFKGSFNKPIEELDIDFWVNKIENS